MPRFSCADCGHSHDVWISACSVCGSGAIFARGHDTTRRQEIAFQRLKKFSEIPARQYPRDSTGFINLDKILGGGLVPGSAILVTGEPGAGKSTLMLQVLGALVNANKAGAMIHAEESADQLAARAIYWEMQSRDFFMCGERVIEKALASLESLKLDILLVDSLQTICTGKMRENALAQLPYCTNLLVRFAQKKRCTVILIGHVTKDGEMQGPQTLKHLVDVTLHLEFSETQDRKRDITAIKNRYGPSPYTLPLTISAFGFRNDP